MDSIEIITDSCDLINYSSLIREEKWVSGWKSVGIEVRRRSVGIKVSFDEVPVSSLPGCEREDKVRVILKHLTHLHLFLPTFINYSNNSILNSILSGMCWRVNERMKSENDCGRKEWLCGSD